jgi:hypothetical protein
MNWPFVMACAEVVNASTVRTVNAWLKVCMLEYSVGIKYDQNTFKDAKQGMKWNGCQKKL